MERWQVIAIIIALYLIVTLAIGLVSGRKASKSVQGYVAGDRDFGLLVMYFVLGASVFSAFAFLGGPGWAYSRGAAAFYILCYGVLGIVPYFFIGPKAAALGRSRGYVTQAQLICGRFPSRTLSMLIAGLTLLAFIPYVTLQMRGAGVVIEAVTEGHVPLWVGAAVAYGIVTVYVLFSGVTAVGLTKHIPGPLYADCGVVVRALSTHQPVWRGGRNVYPDYGRTTRATIIARFDSIRAALVLGRIFQCYYCFCCRTHDVATPFHESLHSTFK